MSYKLISSDIEFDEYGDIDFFSSDISTIDNTTHIVKQNVLDRLKTSFGDYYLYKNFGANLDALIGKNNNSKLAEQARSSIIYALTVDDFLKITEFNIAIYQEGNSMFIKLEIPILDSKYTTYNILTINAIYNTTTGNIYAS